MIRLFVFMVFFLSLVLSQCPSATPIPESCDTCVSLDENNPIVPNSQTKYIRTGETMTINIISIGDNATLLICGTLTFNESFNLSNNSSQAIVAASGNLHVTSSVIIDSHSAFLYPLPAKNGLIQLTVIDNNERIMIRRIVYYDIKGVDKLIVYPTIVESEISVWCKDEVVVLELYDSYSRVIRKVAGCGTWDLSDLPSGIYVIIEHTKERILDHVRILKK